MNSFDAVVYLGLVIAMVTGFNTGLVRSAVTILAYLVAVPIAIWAMSALSPPANGKVVAAFAQNGLVFFGVFLFAGMALGKLARVMVDDATGSHAGPVDRLVRRCAGRGARRPDCGHDRCWSSSGLCRLQPQWLSGSKLRPWLSAAGQRGFNSLPPDLAATDRSPDARRGRYSRPDTLPCI